MKGKITLKGIQQTFFKTQLILILSLALFLGVAGTLINIHFERKKRDQNLQNIAEAIAQSPILINEQSDTTALNEYLDSLQVTLDSIDVISVINQDNVRLLHVILGLIQMQMYDEAVSYIENITIVQRATISKIMNAVNEPAVAALLIGKTARAAELNIKFVFREGSFYSNSDMQLPSELLVTVIGNLIENAFEAMNDDKNYQEQNELLFGIYSKPNAVLITVDDTGVGIPAEHLEKVFENGFSTKGSGRGTGLYQVKQMVERANGSITVESQEGIGTSFSVSFTK